MKALDRKAGQIFHYLCRNPNILGLTIQAMSETIPTENELLQKLKAGDRKAFRALFDQYYKYLVVTVFNITGDDHLAHDLAQDVFFEIWKKREVINIQSSLKSYLRRAVVNKTLNAIKAKRLNYQEPEKLPEKTHTNQDAQQHLEADDLKQLIHEAIESLPEKCRMVFVLCRLEGLSHKEVSQKLGISTKTIENQMTKALKVLKNVVQPHVSRDLMVLILLLGS